MSHARLHQSKISQSSSYCVALTGGIATGKSTVSLIFSQLGIPVIDTDIIARMLVEPGKPALQQIADELGREFVDSGQNLNRKKLRKAVFSNPSHRARLENILHPLIGEEVQHQSCKITAEYFLLVVPLLAESKNYQWVDRVLVIDVNEDEQISRLMSRDKLTHEDAESILRSQARRMDRLKLADDVLYNHGSREDLRASIERLHESYRILARANGKKSQM